MSLGTGLTLGPFVSWFLNAVVGLNYMFTFFTFAGLIFVFGTILICAIPSRLDDYERFGDEEAPVDVPFGDFFKNTRVLMALFAYFMAAVLLIFYDPILSLRIEALGLPENQAGLGFSLMAFCFAFSSPFMGCLAEAVDKRLLIGGGFVGITGSLYLTGGLSENSLAITFAGLGLNGVCIACIFAPVIPEIVSTMQEDFQERHNRELRGSACARDSPTTEPLTKVVIPTTDVKTNIPDKGPALAEMSFALGSIIGPILGGWLEDWDGFDFAVDVMGIVAYSFAILYFVVSVGCQCCCKKK